MNIKLSHIALVLMASASFSAVAESVVSGTSQTADADFVVNATSTIGLSITPFNNLSVADIETGTAKVGTFTVIGTDTAVRMINADATHSHCSWVTGITNSANKIAICMGTSSGSFVDNGFKYYKRAAGSYNLHSGSYNSTGAGGAVVGADTYKLSMELVQYTL